VSAIDDEINALLTEVAEHHDIEVSWQRTRTYESAAIDPDSYLADVFRRHSAAVADVSEESWGLLLPPTFETS